MCPWDMKDREESAFLDDFDGEIVKAGFVEGFIPADKTRTGKGTVSHQLFLSWHPLDPSLEAADQPAWYSMGGKGFTFGGNVEKATIGESELELYEKVVDGPKLKTNCRMGLLLGRLEELEAPIEGETASAFMGLQAHLMREKYAPGTRSTLEVEREALMPVKILGKGAPAVSAAAAAEEAEEILLSVVVGKGDKDVADISKMDRIKAVGLTPAKIYKALDKMVADGRLTKDEAGNYQER